jgi:8-oxo-dGTP diphosphatase
MLLRSRPPNAGLWNGLGAGSWQARHPLDCVRREVLEEAGIGLPADGFRFAGIVRWAAGVDPSGPSTGMYAFVAELSGCSSRGAERMVPEGSLLWKPLGWACDPANEALVGNVPRFLPGLLGGDGPREYVWEHAGGDLVGVSVRRL